MMPDRGQNGIDPGEVTIEWLNGILNGQHDLRSVDTSRIIYPVIDLLSGIHDRKEWNSKFTFD
jgi:hypothetical protein